MPKRSSNKKNIRDVNVLASHIVEQATGKSKLKPEDSIKNPAAVALGHLGGLKGGKARANKLTPGQRKEIAQKAAKTRWGADRIREVMIGTTEFAKLDIQYEKSCDCPTNHINCLTAKEWMQSQVALWEFYYEKRDIRDKNIHPAVFPIGLPAKCIKLFTHKGELVLDPFAGIGTTLLAAQDLDRNAVGFDLKQEYVNIAKERLAQGRLLNKTQQIEIRDDARNIPKYLKENSIALCVTSPPYSRFLDKPRLNKSMRGDLRNNEHYLTVQQYSQDSKDIGTLDPDEFAKELSKIYEGILPLLRKRAHCIIDINDLWWENKRYPTHAFIIEELTKIGYELRNVLIWDRRNLVNRPGIFGWPNNFIKLGTTFEYILDFWKP